MNNKDTMPVKSEQIPLWKDSPLDILQSALDIHEPSSVFALFSGGNDSLALLHWAINYAPLTAAVHIDTGTALPGVREHVEATCMRLGVDLLVYETPPSVYENMVLKYGMPGPGSHLFAYSMLKERRLRDLRRDFETGSKSRTMMLMGARRHESIRRMGNSKDISRNGGTVFVNPLIDWTNLDTHRYRRKYGLKLSETASLCHRSGECNCGAFAGTGEREELKSMFPEWFLRIEWLELQAARRGYGWKWGERPPTGAINKMNGIANDQGVFDLGLCAGGCVTRQIIDFSE